ncbi:DUF3313 domain-containing protein [Pseudomonas sp. TH41]|uniref:DUF3313 domain-containing protein n=1 Tax=Pseudomonas sp. TH41 TaxID=2796405 RepID=UPI001911D0B3|nr:DUF3313 domain-containing protein [Pseudomonas sp. TH41]MBK5352337.1 DUF3313 domain-containing protein [Pseudomonas sp. TH41]
MSISCKTLIGVALGSLLLGGCVSKVTEKEQFSGFLPDYQGLQETTSASGEPVLRWVAKGFKPSAYSTVVFKQLELYPTPKPTERVNQKTLQELRSLTSSGVESVLKQKYQVVSSRSAVPADSRTLILSAAITGVSASTQGMRWYEVLPVTAAVGAVSAATGKRDQDTVLYIEADLVDAQTGLPVVKVVRKVFGASLDDDQQMITTNDFKAAIKGLTNDMTKFIQ